MALHMAGKEQFEAGIDAGAEASAKAPDIFDRMGDAGARCYARHRDLPSLIALWPHELADFSPEGGLRILSKLRRALRAERRRARAGHWSYELNRHVALLSAYKGEIALLREAMPASRNGPVAAKPASAAEVEDSIAKPLPRLLRAR
jgi:hypothetical protein